MHTLPTRGFGVAGAMGIGAVATATERGITQGRILDGLPGECKTGFNPLHDSHHVIFGQFARVQPDNYSSRSVLAGSIFAMRNAGNVAAITLTSARMPTTAIKLGAS